MCRVHGDVKIFFLVKVLILIGTTYTRVENLNSFVLFEIGWVFDVKLISGGPDRCWYYGGR